MDVFQVETALQYLEENYPDHVDEIRKCRLSLEKMGPGSPISQKRLDGLFGNISFDLTDEERRMVADAFFGEPTRDNKDKKIVVHVTGEELLRLHEQAAGEYAALSDWIRARIGLDV